MVNVVCTPFTGSYFFKGGNLIMAEEKQLVEKLKEMFPNGKASCTKAREAASQLDIELHEMGKLCDLAGIKIFACELGCF